MAQCKDCIHYCVCDRYTAPNESYPEVGGCKLFRNTADVVPKSEVENIISNQRQRLNEYKKQIVTLQEKLEQAKQEAAREIFAEIETLFSAPEMPVGVIPCLVSKEYAELKKKYQEGE